MPRLIIRSAPLENREFQLQPGTIHLGRDSANDIRIEETSVSSAHCQIVVGEAEVTVVDLHSTNGTFVNQQPVQQAQLNAGDAVRFGNVECEFQTYAPARRPAVRVVVHEPEEAPSPPPASPVAPPLAASSAPPLPSPAPESGVPEAAWCKNHPKTPALFYCVKCRKAFCELCVAIRHTGHVPTHNCRLCASDCVPLAGRPEPPGKKDVQFFAELPGAFGYALKPGGVVLLVLGTLLILFIQAAVYVTQMGMKVGGVFGLAGVVVLTVFGCGYLFSFLKHIITATAQGSDEVPEWPDFTEWTDDILIPFAQMVSTGVFSFLPAILVVVAVAQGHESAGVAFIPALVAGGLFYSMGLLSVSMHDTVAGLNPLVVVVSILRVFKEYCIACVLLAASALVGYATLGALPGDFALLVAIRAAGGFVSLYFLVTLMRVLGLLHLAKQNELGWFKR
jgi:hypothetical protein